MCGEVGGEVCSADEILQGCAFNERSMASNTMEVWTRSECKTEIQGICDVKPEEAKVCFCCSVSAFPVFD